MPEEVARDRLSVEARAIEEFRKLNIQSQGNRSKTILDQPFLEAKDVFMWAVAVGVKYGKKRPLEGAKEGLFFWSRLSRDIELPVLKVVALADTQDIEVLTDEARIQQIAEEYANDGIRIIKREIVDLPGSLLWNLVNFVNTNELIETKYYE